MQFRPRAQRDDATLEYAELKGYRDAVQGGADVIVGRIGRWLGTLHQCRQPVELVIEHALIFDEPVFSRGVRDAHGIVTVMAGSKTGGVFVRSTRSDSTPSTRS